MIRNKQGLWINSKVFSEVALNFQQNGCYCLDPIGSIGHKEFWDREWDRICNGYEVGGAKITGEHYFYLNYCPILRTVGDQSNGKKIARKAVDFPDFWDGDYNYFWIKKIAAEGMDEKEVKKLHLDIKIQNSVGGQHLIVGKSRRKGFSFKNGAVAAHQYTTKRNSLALICAFDKKYLYPKGTMTMAVNYLNFLNEHTDFAKRKLIDKQDHIQAGFKEIINGVEVAKGFKSEIIAITMKDNPDAVRGKSADLVLMEEVGDWSGLKSAFESVLPCVQDGDFVTGQLILYGTGGDTSGSTADLIDMFNNPEPYNFMCFDNIWDDNAQGSTCGYFFPVHQNYVGFIDKQGNSLKKEAVESIIKDRELVAKTAKDKRTLTKRIIENPFNPREAFSIASGNIFNPAELYKQLGYLETTKDIEVQGDWGLFEINENGKVEFAIDATRRKLRPTDFPIKGDADTTGCWVIWKHPKDINPYGLYLAGTDPYDQDRAENSPSLGSTFIMERASPEGNAFDRIVAEYTARPDTAAEHHEQVRRGLLYYGALCLYENERNTLKMHFEHHNSLYLLSDTPNDLLKSTRNTTVNRVKGTHMIKGIKDELEIYARDWLFTPVGDGKCNYHYIYSKPLLKELIAYNVDGNFDRVIAFLLLIYNKLQFQRFIVKQKETLQRDAFFSKPLFVR